jgi:hypothetical protein
MRPDIHALLKTMLVIIASCVVPFPSAAITLADLDHSRIELTIVEDELYETNGSQHRAKVTIFWQIAINGDSGSNYVYEVVTGPTGTHIDPPRGGGFTFGQPQHLLTWGGGEMTWVFKRGMIEWIRTYLKGASRLTIQFQATSRGVLCTARYAFARENGSGAMEMTTLRGDPLKVLYQKFISSTCRVVRL